MFHIYKRHLWLCAIYSETTVKCWVWSQLLRYVILLKSLMVACPTRDQVTSHEFGSQSGTSGFIEHWSRFCHVHSLQCLPFKACRTGKPVHLETSSSQSSKTTHSILQHSEAWQALGRVPNGMHVSLLQHETPVESLACQMGCFSIA